MRYETLGGVIKLQELQVKRRAATADLPTKYLCSEIVSGMKFETRAKLGCQIKSLKWMAQCSRQAVNRQPCNPRDLEQLHLTALLLWDSGYSNSDLMLLPLYDPFQNLCSP